MASTVCWWMPRGEIWAEDDLSEMAVVVKANGMPFWGRCTTHFRTYFSGDWDVHWGYGILTHGQMVGLGVVPLHHGPLWAGGKRSEMVGFREFPFASWTKGSWGGGLSLDEPSRV